MMRKMVTSSLKFRVFVLAAAVGMVVAGVVTLRQTPVDAYPEFTPPSVEIQTEALGLSAVEVEQLITVPLEADVLNGVAFLDTIRSKSIPGLSSITLVFEPGTRLLEARQLVQERLNQPAAIPAVSKPPIMLPPVSSSSRTMMIGLSSDTLSLIDMGVLARWTIKPRLAGVHGVANVMIWGQQERQLQVQVDPNRLKDRGVSLAQVVATAGNSLWVSSLSFLEASSPGTGGFFDAPNQRLAVRHVSPITAAGDLARVPVEAADEKPAPTGADGSPLRLGDVANVVEDHQPLIGDAIVDGKPGLMLVVEKLPNANTAEVTHGVEEALDELRPGLAGVELDSTVFRPASFIDRAVHDLGRTMLVAWALLILAIALLFYQWRTALVVVMSILLSLITAASILSWRGATMNALFFAGLLAGLGVVVDDAVIGAENVARRVREGTAEAGERSTVGNLVDATLEVRSGLLFATAIILLPLAPVFFLGGLGSAFGRPLALSCALALLVSLLVAVTVTPALALALFSTAPAARRESRLMGSLGARYQTLFSRATRTSRPALVALAVLALAGLVVVPQVRLSPVPTFKETDFLVQLAGPPGMSLPEMNRITALAGDELRAIPGVRNVGGHVGRAVTSEQAVGSNTSVIWVSLESTAEYGKAIGAARDVVRGYPGIHSEVLTYSEERIKDVRVSDDQPVVVRLFGQDLDVLRHQSDVVTQALDGVDGLTDLDPELPNLEPTLQIKVDLEAAKIAGIKPGDVRRSAATLLSGLQVGSLFEEQKVFDVVVWAAPESRLNVSAIRDLLIDTPTGHVRLGDVAMVDVKPSPNVIERDAVSRFVDVTANVQGRARSAVLADVRSRLAKVDFPLEYHYELVGNFADRNTVQRRILGIGIAVAIAIVLLLQAAFGSWRLAGLCFLTLPFALLGGGLVILVGGGTVKLGSLVGLLTVFGIAVRNGVVLIKRFQYLERHEGEAFGSDLVLRGARERLVPILLTAAATAAFLLPFVLRGDLPGHEIAGPMGAVILGGLVTSTIVSLFLVPALYLLVGAGQGLVEELDLRELWDEPMATSNR